MRKTGRYYYLSITVQLIFLISLAMYTSFQLNTASWQPVLAFLLSGTSNPTIHPKFRSPHE